MMKRGMLGAAAIALLASAAPGAHPLGESRPTDEPRAGRKRRDEPRVAYSGGAPLGSRGRADRRASLSKHARRNARRRERQRA